MKHSPTLVIAAACAVTVLLRVIDNPVANVSGLGALALLCGSVLRHPAAVLIPLAVRAATDTIIELRTGSGFYESWWFDYAAYAVIFSVGRFVRRRHYGSVLTGALTSAAVFFFVSNFGVWAAWPETYAHTLAGLIDCYTKAIPFARGTFLGDVVLSLVFFSAWNLLTVPVGEEQPVHTSGAA
ncbi:MAG: DUF6580 family putative transport protein [Planctomycetaceae bacterium]